MNVETTDFNTRRDDLSVLCGKYRLTYTFHTERYPLTMTVRPLSGVGQQMSLLEEMDEGRTSPNAKMRMTYNGYKEDISYSFTGSWAISDDLLAKLKKQFSELCISWLHVAQYERFLAERQQT